MGVLAAQADNRNLSKERIDLAAAYRLIAHFRMDDSIFTHISAKAPQAAAMHGRELFLLNSYGLRFNEVKASELVTVDIDGSIVDDPLGHGINAAGFTIHSAVHAARPDAACVLHTHTVAGVAVSCMEEGLLPLNQWALQFYDRVAYHAYEGIALDMSERDRLVADLGTKNAMILRNHGLMTCGRTVGEAFILMYYLERACQAQLAALSTGRALRLPTAEIAELTARQTESWDSLHAESGLNDPEWNAFVRLIRDVAPDFES
ncbi:ribulose-5-phosphate 4-epimerase/fuculose-1-phosphate aldolase [Angulomicrobium tetraedrale]|uniref:Ribulose-5-phosphate 4-epimerase/fuculose-1-phosphate aldolase n=1 Tax=Ancylobacter tetraedralis TaxID=217068 RepID=A0A839ZBV5_9HYPH|nr:class II aldolase/adducin family protein [Ancylobacter tetraedralis]MBB3772176.1 ribulose-5-phosphate 4-epimerase/fuculose-1-phosphate aldolase [Ancylobacter tetraedralis]